MGNGDILVGMDGDFNVAWWNGGNALLNQRVCCLRARESLHQRFLFYLLPFPLQVINDLTYSTTVKHLSSFDVRQIRFAIPPLDEQRGIAAFLDRETARIDALIAKKQRLIELLQEKRTALISHVVTKGLDPNAPMKPSGIEWLGLIPEHWLVKRMRYLCSIQTGDKDTVDAVEDGEYPFFVRSQNVERITSYTFDCEGVLTAGDGVGVGKVFHHYSGKFDVHQRVYVMTRFRGVTGRFLYYFLKEQFYKVALEGNAKSTVDSLRRPMFTAFSVSVALLEEQKAIVEYLDAEVAKFDRLVSSVVTAIERLREYRSALISAAVTGKIDVRGEAA
ncbi:MAG: restriction endonuclease subunit S [Planctomycetota bacterium]